MARINSGLLTRIAAPFCKFTLALGAALGIVSAAKGVEGQDWTGGGSDTLFSTSDNWEGGRASNSTAALRFYNGAGSTVTFDALYPIAEYIWIGNWNNGYVSADGETVTYMTWEAQNSTYGINQTANGITLADNSDQSAALKIESGTYRAGADVSVGSKGGIAYLTMDGGSLEATYWIAAGRDNAATKSYITINNGASLKAGQGTNANGMIDLCGSGTFTVNNGGYVYAPGSKNTGADSGVAMAIANLAGANMAVTNAGGTVELGGSVVVGRNGTGSLVLTGGTLKTSSIEGGAGTGTVTLSGGTVVAAADGTFIPASEKLTVTVSGNATLDTDGKTITIDAAMLGDGTLTCVGGGTVTFTSLNSICTIVAANDGTTVNQPSVTYWIGGASGNWSDDANWSSGAVPTSLALFTNSVAVTVDSTYSVESLYLDDNVVVTLTGGGMLSGIRNLGELATEGDKIVLDGVNLESVGLSATEYIDWYADIEVIGETAVNFYCRNSEKESNTTSGIRYHGDLSGSGTVNIVRSGHTNQGSYDGRANFLFYGNNESFSGVCHIALTGTNRGGATFQSATSGSALARWINDMGADKSSQVASIAASGSTIKFGSYEGNCYIFGCGSHSGNTIEIGALNTDFSCSLSATASSGADRANNNATLRKVGTGTMTFGNATGNPCFNYYEMAGGILKFANASILSSATGSSSSMQPSYKFTGGAVAFTDEAMVDGNVVDISALIKNSTGAISIVVDANQEITWGTALASSNKGGLVKDGEGTLTLTKVPLYTGATVVKGGKLIVPFGTQFDALTLENGAAVEVDMSTAVDNAVAFSSGKFSGDSSKISLMNNAPEGYSGAELVVSSGVIVYANGSRTFTWVGPVNESGDYSWENPENWTVGGVAAQTTPAEMDNVIFGSANPGVTNRSAVSALSLTAANGLNIHVDFDLTIQATALINGDLVKTGNGAFKVLGSFAGNLETVTIKGGSVESDVGQEVSIIFNPDILTSANYNAANGAKIALYSDRTFTDLSGSGKIVTEGDLTLKSDSDTSFTGSISGSADLTKTGNGSLTLVGCNSFSGDVKIESGTLKIGGVTSIEGVRYDLDASAEGAFTRDGNGNITAWNSTVGEWSFNYKNDNASTYITSDANTLLGGRQAASFQPDYNTTRCSWYTSSKKTANAHTESLFIAYNVDASINTSAFLWGQDGSNSRAIQYRSSNNTWYWPGNNTIGGFYRNGTVGSGITKGTPSLFAAVDCSMIQDNTTEAIGCTVKSYKTGGNEVNANGFKGFIGEVVTFDRKLTTEERQAVEAYLMGKWSINNAPEYTVIPATADVTMNAGATLDMGGLTQTVASFTGAGTVANGSLKTMGDLTVDGGTLTIQATTGQTYVLSDVEAERLVLTGTAKDYTIKVPDNCRIVGRFVVPEGISVGFEGEGADVTVVNAPKGWEITSKHITGGILYRVGSFPFKLILR